MHEGDHGILDKLINQAANKYDQRSSRNHSHDAHQNDGTTLKIVVGVIVVIAIVGVLIWKMHA
ncbi:hypothetical protein REC12_12770 [Desulfosporosinus sp. PR]|uniref:hypothetical protein n=1 Tax=Candidatus Desulfosporosinus nitrosoreducens TaxID=3401928 RepID=UPI0027E901E2|nr:hypothetical protein [Desulfosporosinus sp. PR]MDQ7094463.1 hypothetical protein [Desulfosporosinus sp. PR]